jgi:hypothetical protein
MSSSVFAYLLSRLRPPANASGGEATGTAGETDFDGRDTDRVFAELLASSTVLDFGGVPPDFFQARGRALAVGRAADDAPVA